MFVIVEPGDIVSNNAGNTTYFIFVYIFVTIDAQSLNVRVLIIPFIFQVIQLEGNGKIH